jgi:hypothetical protein
VQTISAKREFPIWGDIHQHKTRPVKFDTAAAELRQQEFARLAIAITPRLGQLRSMTADALRVENAMMWERLEHTLVTYPDAPELVTIKGERKFITICANPADTALAGSGAVRRLRDWVVAASAERGFYPGLTR